MENNEKNGFTYTYSAREQAELKHIREKYTAPTEEEEIHFMRILYLFLPWMMFQKYLPIQKRSEWNGPLKNYNKTVSVAKAASVV